ncbi:MAG: dihydrolipoyl dehydrogenase [Candidatus Omnitrophica bacterium]|nr:dihydrolipoyl dehydrogenase [Candidatus Omnitrophota bacterium]
MHDLIVIGAGPSGYYAARKAAQSGKDVCLIEKEHLGGICLNKGCVPTKFLINTAEILSSISKSARFGIDVESYKINVKTMLERKDLIITQHRQAIEKLLTRHKVRIIKSEARLKDANTVEAAGEAVKAANIIIATGSKDAETGMLKFDHTRVLSSADMLSLKEIPKSLTIIGAGYIGCEFACIYNRFGCDVTMIELQPQILPGQDEEMAKRLMQSMQKRGIKISLNTKLNSLDDIKSEKVLLTIGRKPNIDNIGLEAAGINVTKGAIEVDKNLRTNIKNIYAAGDVIGKYCLAYTAFYEGEVLADNIFGKPRTLNYGAVPACIFTMPELACVGLSQAQAKAQGYDIKTGSYPFMASSKAHIIDEIEGLVKLIIDAKAGSILGAQILGPLACELIHELVVAINKNMTAEELAGTLHAHPTLAEALQDAAKNVK